LSTCSVPVLGDVQTGSDIIADIPAVKLAISEIMQVYRLHQIGKIKAANCFTGDEVLERTASGDDPIAYLRANIARELELEADNITLLNGAGAVLHDALLLREINEYDKVAPLLPENTSDAGFSSGDVVEYNSITNGRWIRARVIQPNADGSIDLDVMRNVNPGKIRKKVRMQRVLKVQYSSPVSWPRDERTGEIVRQQQDRRGLKRIIAALDTSRSKVPRQQGEAG